MEAQLNVYPKPGNEFHTMEEYKKAHNDLQQKGIIFFCNQAEGGALIVLPTEMKSVVKEVLEIELREDAYRDLLDHLSSSQLGTILKRSDHPSSGTKEERMDRVI